jgi:hypothetical protein
MEQTINKRRGFIKKAFYKTPMLFMLGSFGKGVPLFADASGGPPGPPNHFFSDRLKKNRKRRLRF